MFAWQQTAHGTSTLLSFRETPPAGISLRFLVIGQGRSFDVDSTLTQIGSLLVRTQHPHLSLGWTVSAEMISPITRDAECGAADCFGGDARAGLS